MGLVASQKRHFVAQVVNDICAGRWLHELPRELKEAAGPGCACCLFWPPADAAGRRPRETSLGLWQHVRRLPLVQYVGLATKVSPVIFIFSSP